jgi:hypothetical protein
MFVLMAQRTYSSYYWKLVQRVGLSSEGIELSDIQVNQCKIPNDLTLVDFFIAAKAWVSNLLSLGV